MGSKIGKVKNVSFKFNNIVRSALLPPQVKRASRSIKLNNTPIKKGRQLTKKEKTRKNQANQTVN